MKRYLFLVSLAIGLLLTAPVSYDTGIENKDISAYHVTVDDINSYVELRAEEMSTEMLTHPDLVAGIVVDSFGEYPERSRYLERRATVLKGHPDHLFRPPDS